MLHTYLTTYHKMQQFLQIKYREKLKGDEKRNTDN